jgi:hypothetical protein
VRKVEPTYTQMKWSDSRVRDWNDMDAGCIPRAVSCGNDNIIRVMIAHVLCTGQVYDVVEARRGDDSSDEEGKVSSASPLPLRFTPNIPGGAQ